MSKPNRTLVLAWADQTHVSWVLLQFVLVRGTLALKFFLSAKLLGPEMMGLVGIALLCLATVESLSETGLSQASIQKQADLTSREGGAVWTLQLLRGALLAMVLYALSLPLARFFNMQAAASLIALASCAPLIRNCNNPGLYLVQRARSFKRVCSYEISAAFLDLIVTIALVHAGIGAAALIMGTLAGDVVKLTQTWTRFRMQIVPSMDWGRLKGMAEFGKWIWSASFVTFMLNQLDKMLIAKFLGATQLGLYQVASRIAQLFLADGAVALGQYLFPTFSHKLRESRVAGRALFRKMFISVAVIALVIAVAVGIFAEAILGKLLGDQWVAASSVLRILLGAMLCGALIAVLVPYCRALGRPDLITKATILQLCMLLALGFVLTARYGAMGMALATAFAGLVPIVFLFRELRKLDG